MNFKKVLFLPFLSLLITSCGTNREAVMDVKEVNIEGIIEKTEDHVYLIHCTKSASLYNYYLEVQEEDIGFISSKVKAKYTAQKKYYLINNGKDKVTNHGWIYLGPQE